MAGEGIFKKITRRWKKKPGNKVSGDTTRIIKESRKQALYGETPVEPKKGTETLSSVTVHKYSSSGNIYVHVMFTSNLKYLSKVVTKKDPITSKLTRVEKGELDTKFYGKSGRLLY